MMAFIEDVEHHMRRFGIDVNVSMERVCQHPDNNKRPGLYMVLSFLVEFKDLVPLPPYLQLLERSCMPLNDHPFEHEVLTEVDTDHPRIEQIIQEARRR